jgi:predicted double-glycine peptidase
MEQFRLLKRTRQATEYSCGASALQLVLSYWGREVEETELMKLLHTTSEAGTYPEDIVRGARALGFEAEAKENLTLDEVAEFTADGNPMIALAQVWRSQSGSAPSAEEDWDNGHYIVVLGVDPDYVYFQDPYMRMSKAFVPRKTFEAHWHQVMGGDLTTNPKLIHLGIFVRGEKPAGANAAGEVDIASLEFRKMGSLNLIITQFRGFLLPYDFLNELRDLWKNAGVRPNAFIFLRKDKDGNISGMEGSGLQEDQDATAINAVVAALASRGIGSIGSRRSEIESAVKSAAAGDFGLSAADVMRMAQKLPPDHSAMIGLFENVWERRFKEVAEKYAGAVINQRLISPEALAKAASEFVAEGAQST